MNQDMLLPSCKLLGGLAYSWQPRMVSAILDKLDYFEKAALCLQVWERNLADSFIVSSSSSLMSWMRYFQTSLQHSCSLRNVPFYSTARLRIYVQMHYNFCCSNYLKSCRLYYERYSLRSETSFFKNQASSLFSFVFLYWALYFSSCYTFFSRPSKHSPLFAIFYVLPLSSFSLLGQESLFLSIFCKSSHFFLSWLSSFSVFFSFYAVFLAEIISSFIFLLIIASCQSLNYAYFNVWALLRSSACSLLRLVYNCSLWICIQQSVLLILQFSQSITDLSSLSLATSFLSSLAIFSSSPIFLICFIFLRLMMVLISPISSQISLLLSSCSSCCKKYRIPYSSSSSLRAYLQIQVMLALHRLLTFASRAGWTLSSKPSQSTATSTELGCRPC